MFYAFIVYIFIQTTFAKCGLWYDLKRESAEYGPNGGGVIYSCPGIRGGAYGTYSAYNYAFERKTQQLTCNDIEMFQQCKRAQFLLDQFSTSNYIDCAIPPQPTGNFNNQYWCQNIDSFALCLNAKNIIDNSNSTNKHNFMITCEFALQLNDGFQTFNYTKPDILSATSTFHNTGHNSSIDFNDKTVKCFTICIFISFPFFVNTFHWFCFSVINKMQQM